MNLVLLFPEDFVGESRVRLKDHRATHIREVLRAKTGQALKIGVENGGTGEGKILFIGRDSVELEVKTARTPPTPPDVSLILALPRPQILKKVLEVIGAIGVRRLMLVDAARVEKSFFQSKLLKNSGWLKHLRLGMEQGEKTYLPEVTVHPSLSRFLKEMKDVAGAGSTALIADPEAGKTLWDTPLARTHRRHEIVCAVGPEGGWRSDEVAQFATNGFQPVRLGEPILRVENAVCALLAEIELLQMRYLQHEE